jgi:chromosome segregation ATPase
MEFSFDYTKRLFESLKSIGFWGRIFQWKAIQNQLTEANGELNRLIGITEALKAENAKLENALALEKVHSRNLQETQLRLTTELEVLRATHASLLEKVDSLQKENTANSTLNIQYLKRGTELSNDLAIARTKIENLERELREIKDENASLKKEDEFRKSQHANAVASLREIQSSKTAIRRWPLKTRRKSTG